MDNILELIDRQNVIIKGQSEIINSLLLLLMNYMTVEEVDNLDEIKKINELAKLKEGIE